MAENDFDRTEAPTPRRREESRQEGSVARSADLSAACVLLIGIVLLQAFGLKLMGGLKQTLEQMLSAQAGQNLTRSDDVSTLLLWAGKAALTGVAPIVLGITAVALAANLYQVGFLLTIKPLTPDLSKLSPLRGLGRLFDARSGIRLVMSLAKLAVIGLVAAVIVLGELPRIMMLCELEMLPLFGSAAEVVYGLALKLAALLLVLAILDYAYQRWQHERDLRMTKEEVKEELKRMEGDPLIKQRRARVARQLALQRISAAVPKADVVVTNPTHFAVALRYEPGNMTAPKVVAKGADFLALRIRQIAMANGVPLVERRELARALYSGVEVGREIPPQFYGAVAEILAYVYRISGKMSA